MFFHVTSICTKAMIYHIARIVIDPGYYTFLSYPFLIRSWCYFPLYNLESKSPRHSLTALRVPPPLVHPHAGEHRGGVRQGRGDAGGVVPHRPTHILMRKILDDLIFKINVMTR